jgi:N-acetylglucosaminyl-diphospho-decaprenol L-rhamnosyltransferase
VISVHVLIVDYFKALRVVESVGMLAPLSSSYVLKITVVDNSCDISNSRILKSELAGYPMVDVFVSDDNIGYTKAMNKASENSAADVFLALSPDVLFTSINAFHESIAFLLANKDVAVVSPRQINDDSSRPILGRRYPNAMSLVLKRVGVFNRFHFSRVARQSYLWNYDETLDSGLTFVDVDWIQSSSTFMSGNFFREVGGFDTRFFLFMADIVICKKASELGLRSVLLNVDGCTADGVRASSGGIFEIFQKKILRYHCFDAIRYFLFC